MIPGKIIITEKAIENIIFEAIKDCYGVLGFNQPTLLNKVQKPTVGMSIKIKNGVLFLKIPLKVDPQLPFQEVARNTNQTIKYILSKMLGLKKENIRLKLFFYRAKI